MSAPYSISLESKRSHGTHLYWGLSYPLGKKLEKFFSIQRLGGPLGKWKVSLPGVWGGVSSECVRKVSEKGNY